MKLFDTHTHLQAEQFDSDRDAVIQRMREAGITAAVTVGTDVRDSRKAVQLASQHPDVWATVGIDPHEAETFTDTTLRDLQELAASPQVVAIGEMGLDYYWDKAPREVQAGVFEHQLALARHLELPVVIHNREAHDDTLATLSAWASDHPWRGQRPLGVLHCFSGDADMALKAADLGFMISLAGPVTFKNAKKPVAVAQAVPLAWLVIETDAPYLAPHPHRGQRNEPALVKLTAQRIAEIKRLPVETVADVTFANAQKLFGLTDKAGTSDQAPVLTEF